MVKTTGDANGLGRSWQKKAGGWAAPAGEVGHQRPQRAGSEGGGDQMETEQEDSGETWALPSLPTTCFLSCLV